MLTPIERKDEVSKKRPVKAVTLFENTARIARIWLIDSVTRLGYFSKVLETYSLTKLTQILGNYLCYLKKPL